MSKSPDAFRTISEVAEWLDTPAHVLRFWESRFTQVKPIKRAGGRRYYRPADMALLGGIKKLLHEDGMTIKGVQKVLREKGVKHVAGLSDPVGIEDEAADEEIAEAPMIEIDAEEPAETVVPFPGGAPRALAAEPAPEAASDDGWPEAEADSPAEAAEDWPADTAEHDAAAPVAKQAAGTAARTDGEDRDSWPEAEAEGPVYDLSRDFGEVGGAGDIKSALSKTRRALKDKEPDRAEALEQYDKALAEFEAQKIWRAKAEAELGADLRAYLDGIRGTLGIRVQQRFTREQALYMAACTASHRDVSLNF